MLSILDFCSPDLRAPHPLSANATFREATEVGPEEKECPAERRCRMLGHGGKGIDGCWTNGWVDWWIDGWMHTSQGGCKKRTGGWAGCNGGERRAGKAKWIMTMLERGGDRWDVQCCVACLPRPPHAAAAAAAAAPDRAAVGRRSVWTPLPSPAITASSDRNNLAPLSSSLSANHSDTSDVLSTSSSPPPTHTHPQAQ